MVKDSDVKVHLDHLISRESLRWVDPRKDENPYVPFRRVPMEKLKFKDLVDRGEIMPILPLLRKPDFQRETSAWNPEDCVRLLESIVKGLIIPSLIVWKSPDNNFLYILDGAHRVSVMRAWVIDDWGDKADEDYYERHEYYDEIRQAAQVVRAMVKAQIGSYDDFLIAGKNYLAASRGGSPRDRLSDKEYERGLFYTEMIQEAGFHIQEVSGDYEVAEASFLRINKSGQPLDDWETTLIENRNSSFARAVMSIANGGAGRYWPENTEDETLDSTSRIINQLSAQLHKRIFVPPLKTPIHDVNVPFIAASKFFPKHAYLLELLPVIMKIEDVEQLFSRDKGSEATAVIKNGYEIMERTTAIFDHLTGSSNNPLSMSLVPLFYFYTTIGRYVRSSLYGFIAWIMSGSDEEIRIRKTIFSAHRGRFEEVLFSEDMAGAISRRAGSGPRGIAATVQFYQQLLELLIDDSSPTESKQFHGKLSKIMAELTTPSKKQSDNTGRVFSGSQRTKINLREIFKSAIRCEICGGILDLRMGVQYDHAVRYADDGPTEADNGRPTHPFCNNQRDPILDYRAGSIVLKLPSTSTAQPVQNQMQQLVFDLFANTVFPDE
jgi:hypothetical protein